MLGQRRRQCANIKTTLVQRLVYAVMSPDKNKSITRWIIIVIVFLFCHPALFGWNFFPKCNVRLHHAWRTLFYTVNIVNMTLLYLSAVHIYRKPNTGSMFVQRRLFQHPTLDLIYNRTLSELFRILRSWQYNWVLSCVHIVARPTQCLVEKLTSVDGIVCGFHKKISKWYFENKFRIYQNQLSYVIYLPGVRSIVFFDYYFNFNYIFWINAITIL